MNHIFNALNYSFVSCFVHCSFSRFFLSLLKQTSRPELPDASVAALSVPSDVFYSIQKDPERNKSKTKQNLDVTGNITAIQLAIRGDGKMSASCET